MLSQTDGATPLYIASERGRLSVVVALLGAGAALTVRVCVRESAPSCCGALCIVVDDLYAFKCVVVVAAMQPFREWHVADVASANGFFEVADAILAEVSDRRDASMASHVY